MYLCFTLLLCIFNAFVLCQVFNEFNCRRLGNEKNVFGNLLENWMFLFIIAITVGIQFVMVQFGGSFAKTVPLTLYQWLYCIVLGFLSLPIGFLLKFIPVPENNYHRRKPVNNIHNIPEEQVPLKIQVE